MNFVAVDITLLVLFVIFISAFLYKNRKNLKRDGLLYLYRTKWGMNLIDRTGKKYKKTLGFLSYVSIAIGYILMAGILWLFGKILYLYVAYPAIVKEIKIPPVTPLVPYIDRLVPDLGLPSFYFIYFIVILAIIAITHEFMHGIFMRRYNIKIKSTGFGFFPFFLPVFLAAFVEQDEKSMEKGKTFHQMAILSAGTFANIITTILAFIIMIGFFMVSFAPAGAQFNTYAYSAVNMSLITSINGINLSDTPTYDRLVELSREDGLNEIKTLEKTYLINKTGSNEEDFVSISLEEQKGATGYIIVYDDSPAIRNDLSGAIKEFNGVKTADWNELGEEILSYSPGDEVEIITSEGIYNIILEENPLNSSVPWLGIGYLPTEGKGVIGKITKWISSFKKEYLYYEPKYDGAEFIYDFFWWLVLISFSVALVNMLPMGIFDGGKFFYLTIFAITKSKRKAERWFKLVTRFLLLLVLLLMIFWAIGIF